MKKLLLIICLLFSFQSIAQPIDSVSIEIQKTRDLPYGPWLYQKMITDSFSGGFHIWNLQRKWQNSLWFNDYLNHYSYSGGQLSSTLWQYWSLGQWTNTGLYTYTYSSLVDSVLLQSWNSSWVNSGLKLTYHNSSGLDTLVLDLTWNNSTWNNSKMVENVFAIDSSLLSQTISYWDTLNQQWAPSIRLQWFKDSLFNDTLLIDQRWFSNVLTNYYSIRNTFNGTLLIHQVGAFWSSFDSLFNDVSTVNDFTYDSTGKIILQYYDGIPGGFTTNEYTYDSGGILVNKLIHSETQGGIVDETNYEWIYMSFPNVSPIYSFMNYDTLEICANRNEAAGYFAVGGTAPLEYHWSPSSSVTNDSIESPNFIPASSGWVYVTVTDALLQTITDSVYLFVNVPPTIISTQRINACIGCSNGAFVVNLIPGSTPVYYYTIEFGPNPPHLPPNDTIFNLAQGIYMICAYDYNGCFDCAVDTIFESNTAVTNPIEAEFEIFPNPFKDKLTIKLIGRSEIIVVDVFGRIVLQNQIEDSRDLDLAFLTRGIYIISVENDKGKIIHRILKQ